MKLIKNSNVLKSFLGPVALLLWALGGCEASTGASDLEHDTTSDATDTATNTATNTAEDTDTGTGTYSDDNCYIGTLICDLNATCDLVEGDWECVCKDGYEGDGLVCDELDPCELHPCNPEQECSVVYGARVCSCPEGYTGEHCEECVAGYQDNDGDGICLPACGSAQDPCGLSRFACDDASGQTQCLCAPGYTGADCETPPSCDGEITFPDPVLDARVRERLGATHGLGAPFVGPIHAADVSPVAILNIETPFDGSTESINDLTGLHCMASLREVELSNNETLADVSVLSQLTQLTWLNLRFCNVSDFTPLSDLTALEWLSIYANPGVDLTPLGELTQLKTLSAGVLAENVTYDIVSNLVELTELFLSGFVNGDTDFLMGLTKLENLTLYGNQVNDISGLANLTALTYLNLGINEISDLGPLSGLNNLKELYLHKNYDIAEIGALSGLTGLERLVLGRNSITDLSPVIGMTALTTLKLDNNPIADITPLLDNPGLDAGDVLWVDYTDCTSQETTDTIAALAARGIDLEHSCYSPPWQ